MKRKTDGHGKTEKLNKRFRNDDSGSAIVIVIIAMALIGILVSAILWSAYMNYMIKISDIRNKKSFYSAETVMEQIVAGLQHEASAAITLSYQEVMQNWNPNGTQDTVVEGEKDRSSRFTTHYLSVLIGSLKAADSSGPVPPGPVDPSTLRTYYYDREKLRGFIDTDLYMQNVENKKEWEGTDDETRDDNIMEIVNNSTLILRNVRVVFTDDKGYVSIINTDICIDVPELVFFQNPSIDSLYDYALIGNTGVTAVRNSGTSVVYGGIYAGVEKDSKAGGLIVEPGSSLTVENARYVISKGDISVEGPSASLIVNSGMSGNDKSRLVPEVYADNLHVDSGTLKLDSKTYVADDLILSGTGSKATLMKEYYGYGISHLSGTEEIKAGESSAILINGKNATVDLREVTKFLLAGRAYIGQKSLGGSSILPETDSKQPVLMGESIAVKGNQIAYLVPAECIGTLDGKTMIGQNPLNGETASSMERYKAQYGEAFQEVDVNKPVYKLGNRTLSDFGVGGNDFRKVYTQYNSADSENKTLLYYYLVLEKEKAAEYFVQYYNFNTNKEAIDKYFGKYASGGIILGDYESPNTQYTILGNSLVSVVPSGSITANGEVTLLTGLQQPVPGEGEDGEGEPETPEEPEAEGYPEISDNVSSMENAKAEEEVMNQAKEYEKTYTALTTNLTTEASGLQPDQNVFNSIIDEKELRNYLKGPDGNGGTITVTVKNGTREIKAVLTNKDYVVKDSDVRLVVAIAKEEDGASGGNVTISKSFNGLVIAQGKITIDNGVKINDTKYDNTDIRREIYAVLNEPFSEETTRTPISFFVNGGGTLSEEVTGSAQVDENGVLNVDLSEIVRYTNWIKK